MSHNSNTKLFDRAAAMIDYWPGTIIEEVIEADLERNDLEALYEHVCKAEAMASQEEFEAVDAY